MIEYIIIKIYTNQSHNKMLNTLRQDRHERNLNIYFYKDKYKNNTILKTFKNKYSLKEVLIPVTFCTFDIVRWVI